MTREASCFRQVFFSSNKEIFNIRRNDYPLLVFERLEEREKGKRFVVTVQRKHIMDFSLENESRALNGKKKKKLTRLGSFSSREVFQAWAKDSLLKPSTMAKLMEVHYIDSLPAVLALRGNDIANLGLPIGQARLFEEAVTKLHAEYEYQEPASPATRVNVEFPRYKSLLGDTNIDGGTPEGYFSYTNGKDMSSELQTESSETCGSDKKTEEKLLHDRECDGETQSGCACQRCFFLVIFMPIILVFSLLGFIAWIILWPINKLSPVGKLFNKVFKTTETLMKFPLEACNWAIGRRRNDLESGEEEPKANYGGTADAVKMKELEKTN